METKVDNVQKETDSLKTELGNIIQSQQQRLVILEGKMESYQKILEKKVVVQSQLEKKVEKVQSNLETKVNGVQSKMEEKVYNVKKDMDSLDTELYYKITFTAKCS